MSTRLRVILWVFWARSRRSVARLVLPFLSERRLVDALLARVGRRLNEPVWATDDWNLQRLLLDAGKLIAKRDGREAELRANPPQPVDPTTANPNATE